MKQSYNIANLIPGHIRDEFPMFVTFLEAYYEFLEQSGNVNDILNRGTGIGDVDTTLDAFVTEFMSVYAHDIPESIVADKRLFLKHISELYRAKGSEKAYKLFFRAYANDTASISYPKDYILRASDGNWSVSDQKWNGVSGLLSDYVKLQDSYYYQDYSYVVRVSESILSWREKVKSVLHPAGMMMFGEVFIQNQINVKDEPGFDGSVNPAFKLVKLLLALFTDKSTTLMTDTRSPMLIFYPEVVWKKMSWLEWNQIKFRQPPYAGYDADYTNTSNVGYWNTYANMQIKDFGNVLISDAIAGVETNLMPEPYVRILNVGDMMAEINNTGYLLMEGGTTRIALTD